MFSFPFTTYILTYLDSTIITTKRQFPIAINQQVKNRNREINIIIRGVLYEMHQLTLVLHTHSFKRLTSLIALLSLFLLIIFVLSIDGSIEMIPWIQGIKQIWLIATVITTQTSLSSVRTMKTKLLRSANMKKSDNKVSYWRKVQNSLTQHDNYETIAWSEAS